MGLSPKKPVNPKVPRPIDNPEPSPKPVKKTGPKVGLKEKLGNNGRLISPRNMYLEAQAKKRQQKNRTLARPVTPMKGK